MSKERSDNTVQNHKEEHGVAGQVGDALHGVSDAITSAHAAGVHLSNGANKIGIAAAIGGEILHNTSTNIVERVVCGAGVGLAKEAINIGIATEAAAVAGVVASAGGTPVVGATVAGSVGIASYKIMSKVTEPLGKVAENVCHASFDFGREQVAKLSQNATFENTVCDKGVGVLQELVSGGLAAAAGFAASEVGGFPIAPAIGITTYDGMKKATESTAENLKKVCHAGFQWARGDDVNSMQQAEKTAQQKTCTTEIIAPGLKDQSAKEKQKKEALAHTAEANTRYNNANLHGQRLAYQQVVNNTRCFTLPYNTRHASFINPLTLAWRAESQAVFEFRLRYGREPSISERVSISSDLYAKASTLCFSNSYASSPGLAEFSLTLLATNLISSYNGYNFGSQMYSPWGTHGEIGGVASQVSLISDLVDSSAHASANEYYLCFPTKQLPFSEAFIQRIQQELAHAYFTYKTLPFFSLHFNQNGFSYPVIHPAYQNTLIGEVIGLLDYWMKGYLNGGVFDEEFLKSWHQSANIDETYLRSKMIDLKAYCKANNLSYLSLRELESKFGVKEQVSNSSYRQPFRTSFRIIAYQEKIERHENILIPHPNFRVEYSIDLMPDYKLYVESYQKEHGCLPSEYEAAHQCYLRFAEEIKEKMPKLPFCRDFFNLLGLINSFCYLYTTLEEMGQKPVIATSQTTSHYPFPKALPPIPVRYFRTFDLPLTLEDVLQPLRTNEEQASALDQAFFPLFTQKAFPDELKKEIESAIRSLVTKKLQSLNISGELNEEDIARLIRLIQDAVKGLAMGNSRRINQSLNANFKRVPLKLSSEEALAFIKLPIVDKIKRIEVLFSAHLQFLKERWEAQPELAKEEVFSQLPLSEHGTIREMIQTINQEVEDCFRGELQKLLTEYDEFTQAELNKFVEEYGSFLVEEPLSFQQKLEKEKEETLATFESNCRQERADIEKIRQHLQTQIQAGLTAITQQEAHKNAQVNAVPVHLRAVNQANINSFVNEQNQIIAGIQAEVDQLRVKLAEFEKRVASEIVNPQIEKARQDLLKHFEAKAKLKDAYENYKRERATGRQEFSANLTEEGKRNLTLIIKDKLLGIMSYVFAEYTKEHELYLDMMQHFATKLLSVAELAKSPLTKNYTHSFIGFSGNALDEQTQDRFGIIGGCGMSIPNLESKPIPHQQEFCEKLASVFTEPEQKKGELTHNGVDYSVYCLPVYNEDELILLKKEEASPPVNNKDSLHQAAAILPPEEFSKVLETTPILLDEQGYHPLHYAARTGNKEVMALLLAKDSNLVDIQSNRGLTPLMIAIQFGQQEVMEYLHHLGANFNHSLPNDLFPLYMAIQKNFTPLAFWMIANVSGLDINKELDSKMTCLHLAFQQGELTLAKKLIEKGARCDIRRKSDGYTAFHCAAEESTPELLDKMLATGGDVNLALESKKTALHLAAQKGQLANVEYLVAKGADLNAPDLEGNTPLFLAIFAGQLDTALWLAERVELNKQNHNQQTASLIAQQISMALVADVLIKRGEDPNLTDKTGHSYLSLLVQKGDYRRLKMLAQNKVPMNVVVQDKSLLALAAMHGHFLIVNFLKKQKVSYKTAGTLTLLDYAVMADEVGFLRKHIGEGNLKQLTLHAISHEASNSLEILLAKQTIEEKQNPAYLKEAIAVDNEMVVRLILKSWQDINRELDNDSNRALHFAVKRGAYDLLPLLAECGANFSLKNRQQQTVFDLAVKLKDTKLLSRLLKASQPKDWPASLWENKDLDKKILRVLDRFSEKRVLKSIELASTQPEIANLVLPTASSLNEFPNLSSSERLIYKEFKESLRDADFDKANDLLAENECLVSIMRSEKGGALFQLIFENTEDLNTILSQFLKGQKLAESLPGPDPLLALLKTKSVNPALYLGKDSVLLPILKAKDDKAACFKFDLLANYFPEAIPILTQEKIAGRGFIKQAHSLGYNELVDRIDALDTLTETKSTSFYALHEAVKADNYDLAKRLLARHSANTLNEEGQTPLMLAAALGNLPLVQLLLSKGAALNQRDFKGNHVLHYALEKPAEEVALSLLPLLKNPNLPNASGQTPLMKAAAQQALSVVRSLCHYRQGVKSVDGEGKNALHYAALAGQTESIRYLIKEGFNVDEPEMPTKSKKREQSQKRTPLHLATLYEHEEAVFCLLEEGANPDKEDSRGFALGEYAILSKNTELFNQVKLLHCFQDKGRDGTLLHAAVKVDNVDALAELILDEVDLNALNKAGLSALHYACRNNSGNCARLLLQGKDVILDAYDAAGFAPLHYAAQNGHVRLIKLLGLSGVNQDQLSMRGDSALHLAVVNRHEGAVATLLNQGCDLTLTNADGLTAAQLVLSKGNWQLVNFFRKAGDKSLDKEVFNSLPANQQELLERKNSEFLQHHREIKSMMRHRFYQPAQADSAGVINYTKGCSL